MKKTFSLVLLSLMLLCFSCALGDDMGVQIIGGPQFVIDPISLDDFKLNVDVTLEGYGVLNGTSFEFANKLGFYRQGNSSPYSDSDHYESGNEAEYAILRMDIINLALTAHDFLAKCEVKVVFDEVYEYGGWFRQYNYNNNVAYWGNESNSQNTKWVIDKADQFPIDPMYEGHYAFGCALPNAIVESKKPLTMIITIDDHEITYNIRK